MNEGTYSPGLEGVIAGETAISTIEGPALPGLPGGGAGRERGL
jgi:hypothetical protein